MTDVVSPQDVNVYYDPEDTYGDGGSAGSPTFAWIGIIQEVPQTYEAMRRACRGLGSVDVNAIANGLQSPEITIKWIIQRYKSSTFDPKTFLDYVVTWPTGIGLEWYAAYGSSYLSLWYKGMMMDSLDIDFSIDSFIVATAKLVGKTIVDATSSSGASHASNPIDVANGYCLPLTGVDAEVFYQTAGSADSAILNVRRVHFSIKNHIRRIPVIQTSNADLLKYILKSKRELSGSITVFMETKNEYADCLDGNKKDIRIDLQKTDNSPYFDFTGCKIDRAAVTTRINEVPCEVTLPFTATGIAVG